MLTEEEGLERRIRMSREQQRLMEQRCNDKNMEKHYLEEDYFKGKDLGSLKNLEKK